MKKIKNENKGITLIALIITIIVMLILVSVTITMAVNGGLFDYAGKATSETKDAIDAEQKLADGGIEVDGKEYDSIDDYVNKKELPEGIKVGDYVHYTPTKGTYIVAAEDKGSGMSSEQSFTTETGDSALEWRVLTIDKDIGEIEIVSATVAQSSKKLKLRGANGYNHSVDILNDLCETLYSNENGAIARSIKIEDINSKTTYDYTTYSEIGDYYYNKVSTPLNKQYPNIYIAELGSTENGLDETADLLERSDRVEKGTLNASGVTEYIKNTGTSTADTLYATSSWYTYKTEKHLNTNLGVNTAPADLLKVGTGYWLASRGCSAGTDQASFIVMMMTSTGVLGREYMFSSGGTEDYGGHGVRPVVKLDSNVLLTKDTISSTDTKIYWNIEF